MRTGFLSSSRYSPGNMDRGSLETLFVGRRDVMEDVLTRATGSIEASQKHYILLVGPRGSGKTHFLTLAHHRLVDHVEAVGAADRVAIALLKEEEWGVASYLDLVVRILRALAHTCPELDDGVGDVYATFGKDPAAAEALATRLLRAHTRDKTLLLLCENLVDLFEGLGDEGQKRWRAAIQQDGNWAVVATTPQLSAALTLQDNPFFGFFTIRMLDRMDLDTGIELLSKKAIHEGKTELAEFLRTPMGRARVRAIHHLAAGNHRAYVVLFDFLDKESLDDLVGPFMHMVDDLTPYYQDRMRQLAPAQRKILEFLCLEGRPVTVKDIATPCLMSQQTAAKQIGELENAGFVARTRSGRNTFCELAEPLMRICIEIKDNNTGHFRLFVEFLRHWFTTRELQQRHGTFHHNDHDSDVDRLHVEEHLLHIDPGHDHAHYVRGRALMELGKAEEAITAFDKLMPTTHWRPLLSVAAYAQRLEHFAAAARYLDRVEELAPNDFKLWTQRTRLAIERDDFDAALEHAAKLQTLPNGSLLGRLFAAQATAAMKPLTTAWETLGAVDTADYKQGEQLHRRAFVAVLTMSVRKFGPTHLAGGLAGLRIVLGRLLDEGVLGAILTDLLIESVDSLAGALQDWETAIDSMASSLDELPDCRIPLEMLQAAVQYAKTADEKHLLRLPLEQRELLRDVLPSAATVGGS